MSKYQVIAEHYDGGINSWDFDTREEAEKWASGFQMCVTSIHEIKPTPPKRTREVTRTEIERFVEVLRLEAVQGYDWEWNHFEARKAIDKLFDGE